MPPDDREGPAGAVASGAAGFQPVAPQRRRRQTPGGAQTPKHDRFRSLGNYQSDQRSGQQWQVQYLGMSVPVQTLSHMVVQQ